MHKTGTALTPQQTTDTAWAAGLTRSTQSLIFHEPAWLKLIEEVYGYQPCHLTVTLPGADVPAALLPLFSVASPLFGRKLTSQPFNFYGGLLASAPEASYALLQQAAALWRERGAKYLEIKNTTPLSADLIAEFKLIERGGFVRYLVPLAADFAQTEQGFQRRFREKLTRLRRQAAQSGLEVTELAAPGAVELKQFYDLLTDEYRAKHLMLPQPFNLFRTIGQRLPEALHLYVARLAGRMVGGALVLRAGATDYYLWGAYDLRQEAYSPLTLVLEYAMRQAAAAGSTDFDLGITSLSHQGLNFFKSRWGSRCEPLPYYYFARQPADVPTLEYFNSFRSVRQLVRYVPRGVLQQLSPLIIRWLG